MGAKKFMLKEKSLEAFHHACSGKYNVSKRLSREFAKRFSFQTRPMSDEKGLNVYSLPACLIGLFISAMNRIFGPRHAQDTSNNIGRQDNWVDENKNIFI